LTKKPSENGLPYLKREKSVHHVGERSPQYHEKAFTKAFFGQKSVHQKMAYSLHCEQPA